MNNIINQGWENNLDEYLYSQTITGRQEYEEWEEEQEKSNSNSEDYYKEDARDRYCDRKYNQN